LDRIFLPLLVGLFLASEPFLGLGLLPGDPFADGVYQDLSAATRNRIEARLPELTTHLRHRRSDPLAEEHDLPGRESVDMNGMVLLDVSHEVQIPLERDVGIVPSLKQDLNSTNGLALVHLRPDLLEAQHVAFFV